MILGAIFLTEAVHLPTGDRHPFSEPMRGAKFLLAEDADMARASIPKDLPTTDSDHHDLNRRSITTVSPNLRLKISNNSLLGLWPCEFAGTGVAVPIKRHDAWR